MTKAVAHDFSIAAMHKFKPFFRFEASNKRDPNLGAGVFSRLVENEPRDLIKSLLVDSKTRRV